MNIYVNWRSALKAIKNNRKRSILTMLGIVIGISSVITILAIGRGFEKDTVKNLTKNNSKNIEMQVNFTPSDISLYEINEDFFQDMDILTVKEIIGVKKVSYAELDERQIYTNIEIKGKKKNKQIALTSLEGNEVGIGRSLTVQDNETLNKVAVIDSITAKELYDNVRNALGKGVGINGQLFNIVGIFSIEDDNLFSTSGMNIQLSKDTYHYYFNTERNTSLLTITLNEGVELDKTATEIVNKLKERGSMRQLGEYEVMDTAMLTKGIGKILSTITYFITAIAGISLLIAGVGVMNMMYISVSERTKEIGIRRALGATRKSIMFQFLLEGLTLTLIGGFIGYLLGMLSAYAIALLLKINISIDLFPILLTIGISSVIGLAFSVIPASDAAKKDLIDILN